PPDVSALKGLQQSFREVARSVTPAVVNVSAVRTRTAQAPMQDVDPFFENSPFREFFGDEFFRRFFQAPQGSKSYRQQGLGSGFLIDPRGYILTNRHVIKGADEIRVTFKGKQQFKARVIAADPKTDVAVIKIDGNGFPYAKLGDSAGLQVGDWVLAIGNPFGLTQTVTQGIVSAKGRRELGISDVEDFIQTDAPINPGNSGGPLVNLDGEVVGMNTAIASRSGGYVGIGFAIPANLLQKVVQQAMTVGQRNPRVQRDNADRAQHPNAPRKSNNLLRSPVSVPRNGKGHDI
ncbi:MAG: trypsin-like peptidase domain-containing protein, partial [Desulfomonile tiedjei]|nr:trypsin-like peptidase domain-containing protein [Desulfomonile tiedjei]